MILAAQGGVLPVMHPQLTRGSAVLVGEVKRGRWRRCACAVSFGRCVRRMRYGEVPVLAWCRALRRLRGGQHEEFRRWTGRPISIAAKASPGSIEWESASATSARRRKTTYAPRKPFVKPISTQASNARRMNSYSNGPASQLIACVR